MAIPIVGKCFATPAAFLDYLDGLQFGAWRPRFVTVHHTGSPTLANWQAWQVRKDKAGRPAPISDEQWLHNLADYYGGKGWRAGPHFFVTPKNICVLSSPTARGVHAVSFNATAWGVETVGDFDVEAFAGPIRENLIGALAAMHVALGAKPGPFVRGVSGLHFHRDDPKTTKTCPGLHVQRDALIAAVKDRMADLAGGSEAAHDDEKVAPLVAPPKAREGVITVDDLNLRAMASAKSPVVGVLSKGAKVSIHNHAVNAGTTWYQVDTDDPDAAPDGWVAAKYVNLI